MLRAFWFLSPLATGQIKPCAIFRVYETVATHEIIGPRHRGIGSGATSKRSCPFSYHKDPGL